MWDTKPNQLMVNGTISTVLVLLSYGYYMIMFDPEEKSDINKLREMLLGLWKLFYTSFFFMSLPWIVEKGDELLFPPILVDEKKQAFKAITDCKIEDLKKNPLLKRDTKIPKALDKFKSLKEYSNNTMLLFAVHHDHGNLEMIKFLVEEIGVDVNEQNDGGEAAIHRACFKNREDIVQYLIYKGANIELNKINKKMSQSTSKPTPLYESCLRGKVSCVDTLLKNGAEIHFFKQPMVRPFTQKFFDELKQNVKVIINKHIKLRQVRLFLTMQNSLNKSFDKDGNFKKDSIKKNQLQMHDTMVKNYPKELLNLNKNIKRDIMQNYLA